MLEPLGCQIVDCLPKSPILAFGWQLELSSVFKFPLGIFRMTELIKGIYETSICKQLLSTPSNVARCCRLEWQSQEEMLPGALDLLAGCYKTDIAMADVAGRAAERVAEVSKLGENVIFSAKRDLGANTGRKVMIRSTKLTPTTKLPKVLRGRY